MAALRVRRAQAWAEGWQARPPGARCSIRIARRRCPGAGRRVIRHGRLAHASTTIAGRWSWTVRRTRATGSSRTTRAVPSTRTSVSGSAAPRRVPTASRRQPCARASRRRHRCHRCHRCCLRISRARLHRSRRASLRLLCHLRFHRRFFLRLHLLIHPLRQHHHCRQCNHPSRQPALLCRRCHLPVRHTCQGKLRRCRPFRLRSLLRLHLVCHARTCRRRFLHSRLRRRSNHHSRHVSRRCHHSCHLPHRCRLLCLHAHPTCQDRRRLPRQCLRRPHR